ncbi:MAG: rhodanese-like domain-containing protein [Thiolinea sp.]
MHTWTPAQVRDRLADSAAGSLQLLDVREPWEYELVHVEDSLLIPLGQLPQHLERLDPAIPVAVICHHGIRSAHACYFLEKSGFDAINVSGGIDRWARELNPEMALY